MGVRRPSITGRSDPETPREVTKRNPKRPATCCEHAAGLPQPFSRGTIMATAKPRKPHRIAANSYIQAATRIYLDLPSDASDGDPACAFMDKDGALFVEAPISTIKRLQDGSVFVATIAPAPPDREGLILASERIRRLAVRIRQAEIESGRQATL